MEDKKFIQKILNKIGHFGDGELEFKTKDIERLCNIAQGQVNKTNVIHDVSGSLSSYEVRIASNGENCIMSRAHNVRIATFSKGTKKDSEIINKLLANDR